jgi:hypothetical protein
MDEKQAKIEDISELPEIEFHSKAHRPRVKTSETARFHNREYRPVAPKADEIFHNTQYRPRDEFSKLKNTSTTIGSVPSLNVSTSQLVKNVVVGLDFPTVTKVEKSLQAGNYLTFLIKSSHII